MVGRLLAFWDGRSSGTMLNFQGVILNEVGFYESLLKEFTYSGFGD